MDLSFTEFSLQTSQQALTRDALIYLTEQFQLNKNIILFCLWFAASQRGRLRKHHLEKLYQAIHPWHEQIVSVFTNLSASITKKKQGNAAIIKALLKDEIQYAETIEQHLLVESMVQTIKTKRSLTQQLADGCYNIVHYYKNVQLHLNEEAHQATKVLLQTVFTQSTPNEIVKQFNNQLNLNHHSFVFGGGQMKLCIQ